MQLKGLEGLVYCNTLLEGEVYCNRNCIVGLAEGKLYRNTMDCIVAETGQCCIAIQSL